MTAPTAEQQHPHEQAEAPVYDKDGRCLVCCRDEMHRLLAALAASEAECARLREGLAILTHDAACENARADEAGAVIDELVAALGEVKRLLANMQETATHNFDHQGASYLQTARERVGANADAALKRAAALRGPAPVDGGAA